MPRAILARFVVEICAARDPSRPPQTVPGSLGTPTLASSFFMLAGEVVAFLLGVGPRCHCASPDLERLPRHVLLVVSSVRWFWLVDGGAAPE